MWNGLGQGLVGWVFFCGGVVILVGGEGRGFGAFIFIFGGSGLGVF